MIRTTIALLLLTGAAQAQIANLGFVGGAPTGGPVGSGFLPTANDVSANWQRAGDITNAIPLTRTQCGATLTPSGIVPPASGDDMSKLNAAITACPSGGMIQFGAGTFNYALSQLPIVINKAITLRGAGAPVSTCNAATGTPCWSTILQTYDGPQPKYTSPASCGVTIGSTTNCPNTNGFILIAGNGLFNFGWAGCNQYLVDPTASNCGTTIAVDAPQGATTVQVASTTNFSVGMWVLLDEWPALQTTTNPVPGQATILASPEFANTTNTPAVMKLSNPDGGNNMAVCTGGGTAGYSFCVNRLNQELHQISAIGPGPCPGAGCTLTFDSPLTLAFRQSGTHDARVYWPTLQSGATYTPFLQQAGIENMTINRTIGGAVNFEFCAYCWVLNVECNYWIAGCVNFTYTARTVVRHSYLHNGIDLQNNGNEYPLGISVASSENLVEDNIITFGGKGMVGRAAPSNVVAYNYMDKTMYMQLVIGNYWNDMGANGTHFGGSHHFLFEGNWATNCDGDETHGNAIDHVFFRNQCNGMRTTFVDPSSSQTVNDCNGIGFATPGNTPQAPGPLRAAGPMAFNYWYAFVGNVLGFSGIQSCVGGAFVYNGTTGSSNTNRAIWISGWTGGEWGNLLDANLKVATPTSFLWRNGNYDYVNASIVDWQAGSTHTLPNSMYSAARPAWWPSGATTYPWPWIDSTASPPVKTNSASGSGLPAKARFDAGTPFVQP